MCIRDSNKTIEVWSKEYWKDEIDPDTGELMNASEVAESMEQYGFCLLYTSRCV